MISTPIKYNIVNYTSDKEKFIKEFILARANTVTEKLYGESTACQAGLAWLEVKRICKNESS